MKSEDIYKKIKTIEKIREEKPKLDKLKKFSKNNSRKKFRNLKTI